MLHHLNRLLAYPVIWLITLYQRTFSPDRSPLFSPFLRGHICAHEPHCSAYGIQVLKTYGLFPGIIYMIDRISSCTPSQHKKYDPATLRVVFASSAPIGVPFLEKIASDPRYDLVGVVTNPDVPSGRGMKVRPNIIKTTANLLLASSSRGGKGDVHFNSDKTLVDYAKSMRSNPTDAEAIVRDILRNKQYDGLKRRRQHPIGGYILDFYCHELCLGLEIDGSIHNTKEQQEKDIHKEKDLQKLGINIARITNDEMMNSKKPIELIQHRIAPLRRRGDRGEVATPHSLRLNSKKYGQDAKDFTKRLENKSPDLLVVIAYGKIIPQHILDIPAIAPINVHGSLLPKYRGASPIQSVLLQDESETGITIMRMEAGLDTGPMLSKKSFPLTIHTTALDIIERFQEFGPQQLVDTMRDYTKGHIKEIPQPDQGLPLSEGEGSGEVSHCSKLEKSDGLIDPRNQSLHQINNIYRGCYLRPKAHFVLPESRGDHVGKSITIDQMTLDESLRKKHKNKPLIIPLSEGEGLGVRLNDAITSLTVKPANKRAMSREEFLRGYSFSE